MQPGSREPAFDLVHEDGRRVRFVRVGSEIVVHMLGGTGDRRLDLAAAKALYERLDTRGFNRLHEPGEPATDVFFRDTVSATSRPTPRSPRLEPGATTLLARDLQRLTDFYHEALGWPVERRGDRHAV